MPQSSEQAESRISTESKKFLWSALDRVIFISVGVIGTISTSYITGVMKLNPPKLVAMQSLSAVDSSRPVPSHVGALRLDYDADAARAYSVYRVDIANEGRGSAENVRFQVKMPETLGVQYEIEPDLKVYTPAALAFEKNEFYTELAHFPSGAHDFVAFRILGDTSALAQTRVKFVNDEYEGEIEGL